MLVHLEKLRHSSWEALWRNELSFRIATYGTLFSGEQVNLRRNAFIPVSALIQIWGPLGYTIHIFDNEQKYPDE